MREFNLNITTFVSPQMSGVLAPMKTHMKHLLATIVKCPGLSGFD